MIVFLLEERSMEALLNGILPKIIGNEEYKLIPHEGKNDLLRSIPKKLKCWTLPNTKFVIVHDQDNNDCVSLKGKISEICRPYKKDVLIRIVCRELEAWYFGDLEAVEKAYNQDLKKLKNQKRYSDPDLIIDPKEVLKRMVPGMMQIDGAKRISKHMEIKKNKSHSFQVFVSGVQNLIESK
jgi:hypothetical protein